jgi:Na+/melibiose symporter-like transporter
LFWGIASLVVTLWLVLFSREKKDEEEVSVSSTYKTIWDIFQLSAIQKLIMVLFLCKIGFMASESVVAFKLLEKGFKKEDLALAVLIDFPLQIIFSYYVGKPFHIPLNLAKWSSGKEPLKPWLWSAYFRLALAAIAMYILSIFPKDGVTVWYYAAIIAMTVTTSFVSNVMFVSQGAFFAKISDPKVGGKEFHKV